MDTALAVEEFRMVGMGHDGAMPDVGMDIETGAPVAPEADELLRRHIVAGQRQRHEEALAVKRVEELPAIGMVVRPPDQGLLALAGRAAGGGLLGPVAPAEEIAVADRVVAGVEGLALPPELEQAGGHPALVTGVQIDRPPALSRPADDLDGEGLRLVDQAAVSLEALVGGHDQ